VVKEMAARAAGDRDARAAVASSAG